MRILLLIMSKIFVIFSQFEIVAQMANTNVDDYNFGYPFVFGKKKYARILIRRKSFN